MFRKSLFVLFFFSITGILSAGNWMQWRGPYFNGSTDETGLVSTWSIETNTKWCVELPGNGSGTPVICNGRVFVSSTDKDSEDLLGLCFDSKTGKEIWKNKISTQTRKIARNGDQAAPSACTDGERVYFTFENGVIAALDYSGNLKWKRNIEKDYGSVSVKFGYSSTPLLFDGRMYVLVIRRPELDSFILAIDPKTGENIFKQKRQFDVLDETYESYSSAIPFIYHGKKQILVNAADHLTAHDPATGKDIWKYKYCLDPIRWGRNIASVVTGNEMVFGVRARGGETYAIKGDAQGIINEKDIAWKFSGPSPDVSTPLFYRDRLYVLDGKEEKVVSCLDPKNGKVIWQGKLAGKSPWRASLTAADGKIYCINEKGVVIVLDAESDEFKEICRVDLEQDECRASIAIAEKSLFIRTGSKLYCIGK